MDRLSSVNNKIGRRLRAGLLKDIIYKRISNLIVQIVIGIQQLPGPVLHHCRWNKDGIIRRRYVGPTVSVLRESAICEVGKTSTKVNTKTYSKADKIDQSLDNHFPYSWGNFALLNL